MNTPHSQGEPHRDVLMDMVMFDCSDNLVVTYNRLCRARQDHPAILSDRMHTSLALVSCVPHIQRHHNRWQYARTVKSLCDKRHIMPQNKCATLLECVPQWFVSQLEPKTLYNAKLGFQLTCFLRSPIPQTQEEVSSRRQS